MAARKELKFTVAVNMHDTLSIPIEDIEELIGKNSLDIDINNLTQENIETIYQWVNAEDYSVGQDYIETEVFNDFKIEEVNYFL